MQNPIPVAPVETTEQVKRLVFCRYYDDCLDVAIDKDWLNFSCEECQGFELEGGSFQQDVGEVKMARKSRNELIARCIQVHQILAGKR